MLAFPSTHLPCWSWGYQANEGWNWRNWMLESQIWNGSRWLGPLLTSSGRKNEDVEDVRASGWSSASTFSMTSTLAPQAAVLDGIGLQWLLDPTTDVVASVTTYITSSISRWRSGL